MADEKQQQSQLNVGRNEQQSEMSEEQRKKLFNVNTAPLRTWPEVVGMSAEDAKNKIQSENPDLTVVIIPEHSIVTLEYNRNRVRLFVDSNCRVTKTPMIG
uniref:TSA: Wollemia nobilis Ref_Wollemi_Transcript_18630_628 transcribed RNA sequence n=1 Tax=Wollemia nobilis TaxID=56998 RepID=A0A0C9S2T1_9CONI